MMMYTRNYTDDVARQFPEGYSGTMLDAESHSDAPNEERTDEHAVSASGWAHGLGGLGSLLRPGFIKEFKIGTEELLIGAVALFLLFSKNGDKECAIMLLLTLFVTK